MHVRLQKSRIQNLTDHLPPPPLLPTLPTASSSPAHTGSAVDSNWVPKKLSVPKLSVKRDYSRLFLVLPRFHLARIERGWLDSPKPEISSNTHNPTRKPRWQQFRPKDNRDEITKSLNEWDKQSNKEVKWSPRRTRLLMLVEQSSDSSLATWAATFASAEPLPSDL